MRTKIFSYDCIRFCLTLKQKHPLAQHVKRQLFRCSTSVASNYRAAFIAPTRKSFGAKLSICAEEADETAYWLEVVRDFSLATSVSDTSLVRELVKESDELTRIFIASRKRVATSDAGSEDRP
jgi:four helix bundle protein